jgi:hypothetical protein
MIRDLFNFIVDLPWWFWAVVFIFYVVENWEPLPKPEDTRPLIEQWKARK